MINSVLGEADCIDVELSSYVKSVVGPAPELQLAVLVIEGEPGDVYLTGGLEDPCNDVDDDEKDGGCDLVVCRCTGPRWSPPRSSGRSHQMPR